MMSSKIVELSVSVAFRDAQWLRTSLTALTQGIHYFMKKVRFTRQNRLKIDEKQILHHYDVICGFWLLMTPWSINNTKLWIFPCFHSEIKWRVLPGARGWRKGVSILSNQQWVSSTHIVSKTWTVCCRFIRIVWALSTFADELTFTLKYIPFKSDPCVPSHVSL